MTTTETNDPGAAVRMQERLDRMTEIERTKLYAFMESDESTRRVINYALGATAEQLWELMALMEDDPARRRRERVVINGIDCSPATVRCIYTAVAGDDCFTGNGFRRFDEVLYQNPDGYWFLVRPLAPDEAQEWLSDGRHDEVLAQRLFPEDED